MERWDRLQAEAARRGWTLWRRRSTRDTWGAWAFDQDGELACQVTGAATPRVATARLANRLHFEHGWDV